MVIEIEKKCASLDGNRNFYKRNIKGSDTDIKESGWGFKGDLIGSINVKWCTHTSVIDLGLFSKRKQPSKRSIHLLTKTNILMIYKV